MVTVNIPVLYGNTAGSKSLHGSNRIIGGRDWAARVPDLAAAINSSGAWIFCGSEIHAPDDEWSDSSYPAGGHKYLEAALKALVAEWTIAGGAEGNWTYYRNTHLSVISVKNFHYSKYDRGLTDVMFQDTATGFQFHAINSHFTAHDAPGHDKARAIQARETVTYMKDKGRAFFGGDINSSSYRSGFPRDIFKKAKLLGLRERGITVTNGGLSSFSKSAKQSYWLDEIFTRTSETVTGAALILMNGVSGSTIVSDHNWLKATIGFDAGAIAGAPTGPYIAPPSTLPAVMPAKSTGDPWVASVRDGGYRLGAPIEFKSAKLVENYNEPDELSIIGRTDRLRAALEPGYGLLLYDDRGQMRFSGPLTKVKKRGDGYTELSYMSDLVWLWCRKCYPVPSADWATGQSTAVEDVVTGSAEARLLSLVNRNLGPAAPSDQPGVQPRRHPLLRLPASLNRGPSASQSLRFDSLGDVSSVLAELASLHMRIVQTYDADGTPHLDLTLDDSPDLSDWASFGTPEGGGPYTLSSGWSYEIGIPLGTTILSAAGGEGTARVLTEATDEDAEDLWNARIEMFLDQRGTTDPAEISNHILDALAKNAGPTTVAVPIGPTPGLGTVIPLGAQVTAMLDGDPIVDRIRQITTTLSNEGGQPSVSTSAIIGSPDAGVTSPSQRVLSKLLKRVQNLENQ